MKKADIEIGGRYHAKVSGKQTVVEIIHPLERGGWEAMNTKTGHTVRINSARRLRSPAGGKFIIVTGDGYFLTVDRIWVKEKTLAKRFDDVAAAKRFYSHQDQISPNGKGVFTEEVAK